MSLAETSAKVESNVTENWTSTGEVRNARLELGFPAENQADASKGFDSSSSRWKFVPAHLVGDGRKTP